jgi:hypothetical protein
MKPGEIVEITQAELDELLRVAKTSLPTELYGRLEQVLQTFAYVMVSLQNAKTSIKRLRQMLFGARTEHKRHVLAKITAADDSQSPEAALGAEDAATATAPPPPPPRRRAPRQSSSLRRRRSRARATAASARTPTRPPPSSPWTSWRCARAIGARSARPARSTTAPRAPSSR